MMSPHNLNDEHFLFVIHCISYRLFADYLTDVYGNIAMMNYPYGTNFIAQLPAYPVREFCNRLKVPLNDTQLIQVITHLVRNIEPFHSPLFFFSGTSTIVEHLFEFHWEG